MIVTINTEDVYAHTRKKYKKGQKKGQRREK
jgi:hypothetical protein